MKFEHKWLACMKIWEFVKDITSNYQLLSLPPPTNLNPTDQVYQQLEEIPKKRKDEINNLSCINNMI